MASITLNLGATTAQKSTTDQKAQNILWAALLARGFTEEELTAMTAQELADEVVSQLVYYLQKLATSNEIVAAESAARAAVMADPPSFD